MELINILIIITSITICLTWAHRKKREIATTQIDFNEELESLNEDEEERERKKAVLSDEEDLRYIADIFQKTINAMLTKIIKMSAVIFGIMSLVVWFLLEESLTDFGQGFYFFIGSFGQMGIATFIFRNHQMFDPRIIIFSRISKWHSMDHIIK
jgi:uncharacterized membrane protein